MAFGYRNRITIPRIKEARLSNSFSQVTTDSGDVHASGAEQTLSITGAGNITVSAVEGNPDAIVITGTGGSGAAWVEDEYSPSNDQVSFSLSSAPTDAASVFFVINGIIYDDTDDYSVSGQTVTWTNLLFNIQTSDKVIIKYK